MALKVFIDTDVAISSLISPRGAAFLLINQIDDLDRYISNISSKEIKDVAGRLNINPQKTRNLIDSRFSVVTIKESMKKMVSTNALYVLDQHDAHIVAGAKEAKAQFLVTYNTKHFKSDVLKKDLNIILATPANLLQYLRSR